MKSKSSNDLLTVLLHDIFTIIFLTGKTITYVLAFSCNCEIQRMNKVIQNGTKLYSLIYIYDCKRTRFEREGEKKEQNEEGGNRTLRERIGEGRGRGSAFNSFIVCIITLDSSHNKKRRNNKSNNKTYKNKTKTERKKTTQFISIVY